MRRSTVRRSRKCLDSRVIVRSLPRAAPTSVSRLIAGALLSTHHKPAGKSPFEADCDAPRLRPPRIRDLRPSLPWIEHPPRLWPSKPRLGEQRTIQRGGENREIAAYRARLSLFRRLPDTIPRLRPRHGATEPNMDMNGTVANARVSPNFPSINGRKANPARKDAATIVSDMKPNPVALPAGPSKRDA